jgi:hypothetical protein
MEASDEDSLSEIEWPPTPEEIEYNEFRVQQRKIEKKKQNQLVTKLTEKEKKLAKHNNKRTAEDAGFPPDGQDVIEGDRLGQFSRINGNYDVI